MAASSNTPTPSSIRRSAFSLNSEAQISGACDDIAKIGYIRASGFESPFGQFYAKAGERGWWREELACGHDVMLDMPNELTAPAAAADVESGRSHRSLERNSSVHAAAAAVISVLGDHNG
jgi:hypothetical protein